MPLHLSCADRFNARDEHGLVELIIGDPLGEAMLSHLDSGDGGYALERDDGWIED